MIIYNYHPITKEFVSSSEADPDPLEPGAYLIPANATEIVPPLGIPAEHAAIFSPITGWSVVPDLRGQTFYDANRNAVVINTLGDAPAGLSASLTLAQLLADAQAGRISHIEQEYESREHADIAYMGTLFQADDDAQKMVDRVLIAQAGVAPVGFGWYDVTNAKIQMTNAELQGLANAIFLRNQPLVENKQAKKAAIRAVQPSATAVDEVNAVVW